MNSKTRKVITITLIWTLLAILLFLYAHFYLVIALPPDQVSGWYYPKANFTGYVAGSLLGGMFFGYLMVFRSYYKTRRKTFAYGILYNAGLFIALYAATAILATVPITLVADSEATAGSVFRVVLGVLTNPASLVSMAIWALIVAGTQFMLQVSDKFGQGVLWNFLTGRYFHPREEERIFMFLDVTSSTTIAERMGHTLYFEFIREFIADVTDPIIDHKGEVYQYAGDEVVVSWKVGDRKANANCVRCFFAIQDHIAHLAPKYEARFDVVPTFKAGLHAGEAMVGEIGVVKKDIAFSGDVLNTTARIQGACHAYKSALLLSTKLLRMLTLDEGYESEALGSIRLKGKEQEVELNTIRRAQPQP
ncbi:MAG: adenylate/guanylate cyclase domain-containing protein [Phaeodactylibacter sp.]|nr:adenylate/guanylate cyclase domain-containing protein [Phaeodactylibacter sp.]